MMLTIGVTWVLVNVAAVVVLAGFGAALKRGPMDGVRPVLIPVRTGRVNAAATDSSQERSRAA